MTPEEMQAIIAEIEAKIETEHAKLRAELEAENAKLEAENAKLRGEHRTARNRLPDGVMEKYPFIRDSGRQSALSLLVRASCFPPSDKLKMRPYGRRGDGYKKPVEQAVLLLDMSDEQYEIYLETVTEILETLKKHRTV